ncbi:MAG: pyridoxamine 5'-phosphate oxidase family protein [Lachnospiraceae bacterium]|nr:pyridoxamine 5'-phosphate oxidase family protein [Lachnospiraceae bacterium]
MFREMRRSKQIMSSEACEKILNQNTSGVLALSGDNGYPYAVPLSYVYSNGDIYFHCAIEGHKIDAIKSCNKASFCIIDKDTIVPGEYTTYYRSVVAFGKIHILEDAEDKMTAIKKLADKYSPFENAEKTLRTINSSWERFCIARLSIEHLSGKQAKELINPVLFEK